MPRGERPEPAGAHNWNKETALETRRRQQGEYRREQAEFLKQYRRTSIDTHIAGLREQAATPLNDPTSAPTGIERNKQESANAKHTQRLRQQANVYSYMKDRFQAKTVGDVEENLRQHRVDQGVVRLWVEGRMLEHDDLMEQAIGEGYPELDDDMQNMREKQHWRKADNVSDFLAGLDVDEKDL